jgi:hypothetical protein
LEVNTWVVALLPAAGLAGVLLQQTIEVWKTTKTHSQELQRRFFDRKFEAAIDLARSLDAIVSSFGARLAEGLEWTRDDEQFTWLELSREVLSLSNQALEKNYERYVTAYAVVDLLFPTEFVESPAWRGMGDSLTLVNRAWRPFDERKSELIRRLNKMMSNSRREELRDQRIRDQDDDGVREEIERWIATYKQGTAELRAMLPRLGELTVSADQSAHAAVRALRAELRPYHA